MAASTGNESVVDCVLRLLFTIGKMVMDGTRSAEEIHDILQLIKNKSDWRKWVQICDVLNQDGVDAILRVVESEMDLPTSEDIQRQLNEWQKLYTEVFGLKNVDFSQLHVPTSQPGFTRMLVICTDLKLSQIFQALGEKMSTRTSYNDLDTIVSEVQRPSTKFYVILVRDRVEADEELKGLSANQIKEQRINTLNLQERLLYELKYFLETGQHLDVKNVTLCAGSRDDGDSVPEVYWSGGRLEVGRCHPTCAYDRLRARQTVS